MLLTAAVLSAAGITLSPNQVRRATELAHERGLDNASFAVMDALKMEFEDDTFDLVWACESGEHMPDKRKYVEEMTRVLKPGAMPVMGFSQFKVILVRQECHTHNVIGGTR